MTDRTYTCAWCSEFISASVFDRSLRGKSATSLSMGPMSASGQTRTIRACPLHARFTPKLRRSEVPAELSEKGQDRTSEKGHSSSLIIGLWDSRESRLRPSGATNPYILSIITPRCRFSTSLNLSNFGAFFSSPRAFLTKFRLSVADNGRIVGIETAAHASHEFISASYSCR